MKAKAQLCLVIILLGVYVVAFWAISHPHVSPAYKAYFVDRSTSEWDSGTHFGTPENGISFSEPGLPQWITNTRGLSFRQEWGRWTDSNVAKTPALVFDREFRGPICIAFTAGSSPSLLGKPFAIRMGDKSQVLQAASTGFTEFRVPFVLNPGSNALEFILPQSLALDWDRRLGLALVKLQILSGNCTAN